MADQLDEVLISAILRHCGGTAPCRTRSSIAAMKAASVLPDPVGAAIRTLRLDFMAGQAWACAAVGRRKLRANQEATVGWNGKVMSGIVPRTKQA